MPQDLIATGAQWLAGQRGLHMARAVQYVVAGGSTVAVDATRGRTEFEVVQGDSTVRVESVDWIVPFDALESEPKRGDRIVESAGGSTWTYEVLADAGIPPFSWCDASRTGYRVHTKLVVVEEA